MKRIEQSLRKLNKEPKNSIRYQDKDNRYVTDIYILREAFTDGNVPKMIKVIIEEE